jgi:flagellin
MSMTINSIASASMQKSMQQLSTGLKINKASDDAAGMAILQSIDSQVRGLEMGSRNTADMSNLITTAEGASGAISEVMQRARELTVQSQNATLTDSDREIIQNEVNQLMGAADSIAKGTEFNKQQLLTGEFSDKNTASSPNGTGKQVSLADLTLKGLDLENFSVSSENSIEKLDKVLNTINSARANMGASINTMQSVMNSNSITQLNLAAAKSRIADTDMAKTSSNNEKNKLLENYSILMQKKQMEQEKTKSVSLFL